MSARDILFLRADASSAIGVGHVMRCLALAQAWEDAGGEAVFACAELPPALAERLQRESIRVVAIAAPVASAEDIILTVRAAREADAAWIVVDGYCFAPEYYAALRAEGFRVLALDDMAHLSSYPVDALLNQNLSATPHSYAGKISPDTELLLGPRHSLLRREFRVAQTIQRSHRGGLRRVLVSFGGADTENFTGRILENLFRSVRRDFQVVVLAGPANPHVAALRALAASAPVACEVRVGVENVAVVMAFADVAITAGGSTVWELASMRLPALIGASEDNQLAGLAALQAVPFFRARRIEDLLAGDLVAETDALLAQSVSAHAADFDAEGAVRVVTHLHTLAARRALEPVSA